MCVYILLDLLSIGHQGCLIFSLWNFGRHLMSIKPYDMSVADDLWYTSERVFFGRHITMIKEACRWIDFNILCKSMTLTNYMQRN